MKMISNDLRSSCRSLLLGAYQDSGGGDTPTEAKWEYPSNWLPLPDVGANEAAFLIFVKNTAENYNFSIANGDYDIKPSYADWGDGAIYNGTEDTRDKHNNLIYGDSHFYYFEDGTPLTDNLSMFVLRVRYPDGGWIDNVEIGTSNSGIYIPAFTIDCSLWGTSGITRFIISNYGNNLHYVKFCGDPENFGIRTFPLQNSGNLKRVDFENPPTKLPDYAFNGCNALNFDNLPDLESVTDIGNYCFCNCNSLEKISLPSLTAMGDYCFQWCMSLDEISMPELLSVGSSAFYQCYGLQNVNMPKVTSIGDYFAQSCSGLKSAMLPALETIGSNGFDGCPNLGTLDLSSLTTIANNSIGAGCPSLNNLVMPNIDITQSNIFPQSYLIK